MGPGRTAPSGLYVLPWTSYYFNADVSHFNFLTNAVQPEDRRQATPVAHLV